MNIIYRDKIKSKKTRKARKKHRSQVEKLKALKLNKFAKKLESKLPRSEKWFRDLWKPFQTIHKLEYYSDRYNQPEGPYIPDVINQAYKYVIEIDGSIHDFTSVKLKDAKKEWYFLNRGYKVFRIKAYDLKQFEVVRDTILKLREDMKIDITV